MGSVFKVEKFGDLRMGQIFTDESGAKKYQLFSSIYSAVKTQLVSYLSWVILLSLFLRGKNKVWRKTS